MRKYCEDLPDDWEDPIVAEIHEIRQRIMEEFDYDLGAYLRYIRRKEKEEIARGSRRYVAAPARRPRGRKPGRHRLRYAVSPRAVRWLPASRRAGRGRGR
jgi:hypothetical protein